MEVLMNNIRYVTILYKCHTCKRQAAVDMVVHQGTYPRETRVCFDCGKVMDIEGEEKL